MKPSIILPLAASLALSSCVAVVSPGPSYPPVGPPVGPGYGSNVDAQRKAYEDGFMFGRRDARNGKQANYMLYNTQYNASTKKDFGQGYMNGYRSYRPRR
jgi:hypothetical protein